MQRAAYELSAATLMRLVALVVAAGGCGGSSATVEAAAVAPPTVELGAGSGGARAERDARAVVPDHEALLALLQASDHPYLAQPSCRRFGIYSSLVTLGGFVVMNVEAAHNLGSACNVTGDETWCRTCFDVGGGPVGLAYRTGGAGDALSLLPESLQCLEPDEEVPSLGEGCATVALHAKRRPLLAPSLAAVDREYASARWVGPLQSCVEHLSASNVSGVAVLNLWLSRGAVTAVDYEADPAIAPALPCLRKALVGQLVLPAGDGHLVMELEVGGHQLVRRVRAQPAGS